MRHEPRLPVEALAPYLVALSEPAQPLVWDQLFGRAAPVEIEIGHGKGLFLRNEALARPDSNFVGIELVPKYHFMTANRIAKRVIPNIKLIRGDAKLVLRDHVTPGSVSAVHIYFPDPWWKKRHHKRRLFTEEFVALCEQVLQPRGVLHLATDVPEYFVVMQELLSARPNFQPEPVPEPASPAHDMDYMTNFERRFRKMGKPIHRARYVKQS